MQFLLKFILIAISIIWLLRLLARFLFPWAMRKAAEKVMGNAQQPFQQQRTGFGGQHQGRGREREAEGKIHIDYVPPKEKTRNGSKNAGEFVEFEEVTNS